MKEGKNKLTGGILRSGTLRIILCAAVGVLLILVGNFVISGKQATASEQTAQTSYSEEVRAYAEAMESEIASLCTGVRGAGSVTVAVTLSGGFVYEYAENCENSAWDRTSSTYVTVGSGSSEKPVYLSVRPPQITGIGVVCKGGGNAEVRRELIALLSAAYGVSSNKIYVAQAN